MEIQKDKPMPGIAFKAMSLYFALRHRLDDVRKPLKQAGIKEGQTSWTSAAAPDIMLSQPPKWSEQREKYMPWIFTLWQRNRWRKRPERKA